MGLNGSLGDFSLQEIIQIISFGGKTGRLTLETPAGGGTVVFRDGRIVASFGRGDPPLDPPAASLPERHQEQVFRRRIAASLDRLARCREGAFSFELGVGAAGPAGVREPAGEDISAGIDVMEVLLELACRQDEERRGASASPGSAATASAGAGSERSVLLVDDEEVVRRLLGRYLVEGGYQVLEAGDVDSAVRRGAGLGEAGVPFVLVADLHMPASNGNSFQGGIEVVARLAKMRLRPPVVIMADSGCSSRKVGTLRALGCVVLKPGLSKLEPEEFEADMRALARRMVQHVLPRVYGQGGRAIEGTRRLAGPR